MAEPPSRARHRRRTKTQLGLFSLYHLYDAVRLLQRRQPWILARAAQERAEA
jgi:hypothetical protein